MRGCAVARAPRLWRRINGRDRAIGQQDRGRVDRDRQRPQRQRAAGDQNAVVPHAHMRIVVISGKERYAALANIQVAAPAAQ